MQALAQTIAKEIAKANDQIDQNRTKEMLVEFTVTGKAVVKRGEDYEQVQSFAVPYDLLLAVTLSKLNGVTVESIVREALSTDIDPAQVKAQASEALAKIKGTAKRKTSGKITVKEDEIFLAEITVCENC
jgi:predicted nucleotidyltransferase